VKNTSLNKKLLVGLLLVALILSLVGCRSNQSSVALDDSAKSNTTDTNAGKRMIKIGVILPFTGVFTSLGENIERGIQIAFDEAKQNEFGYEIEVIKEDTQGDPNVGLQKARKLVLSDKVDLIVGIVSSSVAYAVRDYADNQKVPVIIALSEARELTRSKGSPYIFRTFLASGQGDYPFGKYAYEKFGYKTAVVMGPDYAAGHEKADAFKEGFIEAGGKVVQEIYPPLGNNDFGPYLSQIKNADAVYVFFVGSDAINFVKQYQEYGLKDKIPLLIYGGGADESILPSMGEAAVGLVSITNYSALLDTPENKALVQITASKYNQVPNHFLNGGYIAGRAAIEAINKLKGNIEDKEKGTSSCSVVRAWAYSRVSAEP
jgi:branched-chain amino acid transport system substrate-binding protein